MKRKVLIIPYYETGGSVKEYQRKINSVLRCFGGKPLGWVKSEEEFVSEIGRYDVSELDKLELKRVKDYLLDNGLVSCVQESKN
jgi:hypothetical protein